MAECDACGTQTSMPFRCKFCEQPFCSEHRLPENHDCDGLRAYKDRSRKEGTVGYDVPSTDEEQPGRADPTTARSRTRGASGDSFSSRLKRFRRRAGGLLPSSATTAVLGVIVAVFVLQVADWATGLLGGSFFSTFALNVCRLDMFAGAEACVRQSVAGGWPLLLVTMVTSIFMHGSAMHLLVNGIVLFSFGRIVEQILGTRRFLGVLVGAALASSVAFVASAVVFDYASVGVTSAVGLSGGLYGIVGLLAVIRPRGQVLAFFIIPLRIRHAVGLFAAMDIINFLSQAAGSPLLPFASAGHLGGLTAGVAVGYLWRDRYRRPQGRHIFRMLQGVAG